MAKRIISGVRQNQVKGVIAASGHSDKTKVVQPAITLVHGQSVQVIARLPEHAVPFLIIDQSRSGMKHSDARNLATRLELTVKELAGLLAMNERTAARRLTTGSLNKVESERLLLLTALATHGLNVFEEQQKFNRWLRRPLSILSDQSPLQVLDTATGFGVVDQILGRIEQGVYS